MPLVAALDPQSAFVQACYIVSFSLFIIGIRRGTHPTTAKQGNLIAAAGMAIAVATTLALQGIGNWGLIAIGIVGGSIVGVVASKRVQMTAMPQMVALYNGLGGGAVALIAWAEFRHDLALGEAIPLDAFIPTLFSMVVGSISFWGSNIAFGKLQGLISGQPMKIPGQQVLNALLLAGIVAACIVLGLDHNSGPSQGLFIAVLIAAAILGNLFVLPIGGADMPVVISLLNAFTGLSAAAAGIALDNTVLIVAGTLVGSSGTILTTAMATAMNRSIGNILFAGYGMAVAQAQHAAKEMADELGKKGVNVNYAIHPVAGRMPGHMNVLLAEADVPYEKLKEMDEVNPEMPHTDVAVVIGANDVTNPAAKDDPDSPIAGMPIIEVDEAQQVIVIKRSLSPGFAGIDNDLFYHEKTSMLFSDAKQAAADIAAEIENL